MVIYNILVNMFSFMKEGPNIIYFWKKILELKILCLQKYMMLFLFYFFLMKFIISIIDRTSIVFIKSISKTI